MTRHDMEAVARAMEASEMEAVEMNPAAGTTGRTRSEAELAASAPEASREAPGEGERYLIPVDVGGTKILAGVMTEGGRIVARHKERTERGSKKKLLDQLANAIDAALQAASVTREQVAGIALGVPGVVDGATGHVVYTPNAPLSDTSLGSFIEERFGVPVAVGNDVNVGTLGEARQGAARGVSSAFGIFVGTGIGGGLIINDSLIEGFRGLGGEIGHLLIPLDADAVMSGMGKHSKKDVKSERRHIFLEDICSRTAIENQLRHAILEEGRDSLLPEIVGDKKLKRIRSGALRDALKKHDALVEEVMRRASYHLGLATASVLHIVDPEVVIFGGGVIEACGDWMLPHIEKTARRVALPGTGQKLRIVRSALGDDAILWGGAALLRESGKLARPSLPLYAPHGGSGETPPAMVAQMDKPLEAVA